MKTKIFNLFVAMMAIFAVNAKAENKLSMQNLTVIKGNQTILYVDMTNSDNITALSFDITLPSGVTIVKGGEGYKVDFVNSRKPNGGSVTTGEPNGNTYTVAEFSTSNGTFKGSSGSIFAITLNVSSSTAVGNNTITISNAAVVDANLNEIAVADCSATLTVKEVSSSQTIAELSSVSTATAYDIPASGGKERATATAYYTYFTRTNYTDGTYTDSSKSNGATTLYGEYVTADDLGSQVTERTAVGTSTPSGTLPYDDKDGKTITATAKPATVYQAANSIASFDEVKLSFTDGQEKITVNAEEAFDIAKIIAVSQDASFASGAKGTAEVKLFYNVVKAPEGFDPLAVTEGKALVSVQPTASPDIAQGFTVRVLALGEGNKVAVADVVFDADPTVNVQSTRAAAKGKTVYDLNGRIVPVGENNLSQGIYVIGNQKVAK